MATNTYVALDLKTVSSPVTTITFTGISQIYTDLIIVSSVNSARAANLDSLAARFNGDTASNYSYNLIQANTSVGTVAQKANNSTNIFIGNVVANSATNNFSLSTLQIMNYNNATTFKTVLARGGGISAGVTDTEGICGTWRKTPEAITSVTIYSETGSNFNVGSTFALYGIASETAVSAPKATGGIVYSDSLYYYHTFSSSGTFTPNQSITADALVIAGGGGGGNAGGGGGAGSLIYRPSFSLSATNYAITIGAGGAGDTTRTAAPAASGTASSFNSVSATGGGGGASNNGNVAGGNGGSGGGGVNTGAGGTANAGTLNGGTGYVNVGGTSTQLGSGGGGAGGAGGASNAPAGGLGGVGTTLFSSWGTATGTGQLYNGTYYYAGGGGGYSDYINAGGLGGGGASGAQTSNGANGSFATGGGAGASRNAGGGNGGNGGSGLVIIRYLKA